MARIVQAYSAPIYKEGIPGVYSESHRPFNVVAENLQEAIKLATAELQEGEYLKAVKPFGRKYEVKECTRSISKWTR